MLEDKEFSLLDSIPLGLFLLRPDFTVAFWNSVMEEWTDIRREKILGIHISGYFSHIAEAKYANVLRPIFSGGPPAFFSAHFHKHLIPSPLPSGELRIQETVVTSIKAEDGYLALFAVKDITDPVRHLRQYKEVFHKMQDEVEQRKKVEDELRLHQDQLEEIVRERTVELKKAHERLLHSEKLSVFGKISASVAHEFSNPIFGVRNTLEQFIEKGGLDVGMVALAELAVKECNRMVNFIKRLRDLHQPSTGEFSEVDIHQAIDDMVLLSRARLKSRKIAVDKRYAAYLPGIHAVEDQIKQVILNLLQNAHDAIPETGGAITITTEADRYSVKVHIRDTGHGISEENQKLIFEPFFSTKAGKGTGLGLSVCHEIVKAHGGEISVQSKLGEGTVFTVVLPIKDFCLIKASPSPLS